MGLFGDSLRFAFGIKPTWAAQLPSHIHLRRDQIGRLEMVRAEVGVGHDEFMLHIAGHPETSRKVLHQIYRDIKAAHPEIPGSEVLKTIVVSRWESAFRDEGDLFGLSKAPNELMRRSILSQVLTMYPDHESLIEAIILYEENSPFTIPPAPGSKEALRKVTEILRDQ
jgi:hypothetical protein